MRVLLWFLRMRSPAFRKHATEVKCYDVIPNALYYKSAFVIN